MTQRRSPWAMLTALVVFAATSLPVLACTNITLSSGEKPGTEHTRWTVVCDLDTPQLYVSTIANRGIERLDLATVDPAAGVQHIALAPATAITDLAGG